MMEVQTCYRVDLLMIVLLPRLHQHDAPLVQNLIFAGNRALHQAALAAIHETLEKKNKERLERIMKYISNIISCRCFH
jgi:hypothetical protein